jgi:hypothetical protein
LNYWIFGRELFLSQGAEGQKSGNKGMRSNRSGAAIGEEEGMWVLIETVEGQDGGFP